MCPHCDNGPTTTQRCSWYDSKSPHTKAYEQWLLRDLINSIITNVSMKRGIGTASVEGVINRHIHQQVDWHKIKTIPLLGIDEIALKKGHKDFVVIVSAINEQGKKHILRYYLIEKKTRSKLFWRLFLRRKKPLSSGSALICMKVIATLFMKCYRRLRDR